jgi:hypothetical protein
MKVLVNFERRMGNAQAAGSALRASAELTLPDDLMEQPSELDGRVGAVVAAVTHAVNSQFPHSPAPWDGDEPTVTKQPTRPAPGPIQDEREPPVNGFHNDVPGFVEPAKAPRTKFELLDTMKAHDEIRKLVNKIAKTRGLPWKVSEWNDETARQIYSLAVQRGRSQVGFTNGRV